jgi:2-phosphosulfolactate phosphatase
VDGAEGPLGQRPYRARFDWGPEGARASGAGADAVVVVDVLSFSTAVEITLSRRGTVVPMRWSDRDRADEVAARLGGLATAGPGPRTYTLSPTSVLEVPEGTTLVIPSPNGATVTLDAADLGATVLCGCLRNASAVAEAALGIGSTISVIAAGERWPTGALRPAIEDALGAGAILARLPQDGMSAEARAAATLFRSSAVPELVLGGATAGELRASRGDADAAVAAEIDVSETVPILVDGAYRAA